VNNYPEVIFEKDIPLEWRWERIRIWRDKLLKDSDWRMVEDASWDKTQWATYRQQLRDLPANTQDPSKVVFPQAPNA